MRCKNCGWDNPANNVKCEKCNASFSSLMNGGAEKNASLGKFDPKKTAKGCPECGYPVRDTGGTCPHCGYVFAEEKQETPVDKEPELLQQKEQQPAPESAPEAPKPTIKTCAFCKSPVSEAAQYCSNCGASLMRERRFADGTINPWIRAEQIQMPECSLVLVAENDESINDSPICFSGHVIQLNRGNTEPVNQTITSKTQAELSFEDGKWYLQDKSALKTTYLYAGDKIELKQGNIIVLGNRSFKFGCVAENQPE